MTVARTPPRVLALLALSLLLVPLSRAQSPVASAPDSPPAAAATAATAATAPAPLLKRIRVATIAASDLKGVEADFTRWLGYKVRERGRIPRALAESWGAPKAAGRNYVLMSSDGWPDVFVRAVETPAVRDYKPMTTYGWNAIEIIVDDPDALRASLQPSPFRVIGEPANLSGYPTIRAFQVEGRRQEVLYLTSERGDRTKSVLPLPNGAVGRPFIMVIAGADINALVRFYGEAFGIAAGTVRERPVSVVQHAQGLAPERELPITTGRLAEHGNLIEFDGYSEKATTRPRTRGELPPGVAMTSFAVANLDAIRVPLIHAPLALKELPYAGKRTATTTGPAGELIELIED